MGEGGNSVPKEEVQRVGKVTQDVIADVFKKLGESAAIKAEGATRLFFPGGIELIDVSVSAGLAAKGIEVKVRIAGEKAPKLSALGSQDDGASADGAPDPVIPAVVG